MNTIMLDEPDYREITPWQILFGLFIALLLSSVLIVIPWQWVTPQSSAFMLLEKARTGREPNYQWVDWENINPYMAIAVVAAEDQKFPNHFGFDVDAIQDALDDPRGLRRGASTITQQVAKNLFLWNGRSFVRKAIEAWFTVLIETFWSKRRILEVYLNIAEFGPGVYGIGAASQMLGRDSNINLSEYDCTVLAAVLPNPKDMSAVEPSTYVNKRANDIHKQIQHLGGTSYLKQL